MSLRDRLVPIVAAVTVLAVAVVVVLMLRSATNDGIKALEDAKLAQVSTTARSFDARVESSLGSVAALGARPWELTEGSEADQAVLDTFAVDPQARSGMFLVDADDTITSGVLLQPDRLGGTFDDPGWPAAKEVLVARSVAVLPITPTGMTTDLPTYAFAIAIPGATAGTLRGALVIESAVTEDSTFNQEIQALAGDESTATWRFLDTHGMVVATSASTGLGQEADDLDVDALQEGRTEEDGRLLFVADVDSVGWTVVFSQDQDEFVEPLAGPLRVAGLVLVLLMLAVGLVLVRILIRRLRHAQEEERRLRELSRSQEEFISVVSHELRTPVAGVLGFLQTTLDHWDLMGEQERLVAVRRAFVNARRLQAMTRDVLDTESLESGRFDYTMVDLDLATEVNTAVEGFLGGTPEQVRVDVSADHVHVNGDPDRLQQVLANLLDNARKNAPADTAIRVALDQVDGKARLVVEDDGGGIDADQMERIFEKFVRGRDGTVTGTGLGLYISRRIVEAHGGRIWAERGTDEKTRFVVELPSDSGAAIPVGGE
jgi:signal transduction histidine kinase